MAKLYFYYGAMGSSKTAQALMASYNYAEKGQKALMVKADSDNRDGLYKVHSRTGLEEPCILLSELVKMSDGYIQDYDAVIVDEAQFASKEEIDFLSDIVDRLNIPVMCYGLRADFRNELFPGSARLLAIADELNQIKTVCWCGKNATCNARYNEKGIVRKGAQIVIGGNDKYVSLCRKHFKEGKSKKD